MDITGLNKADVLAALYNASKPQRMGFLQYDPTPMTREEAQEILNEFHHFDYLKGRVMKISLDKDDVDTRLYDRDNGENTAEHAVDILRETGNTNGLNEVHQANTQSAIIDTLAARVDTEYTDDPVPTFTLGLSEEAKRKALEHLEK